MCCSCLVQVVPTPRRMSFNAHWIVMQNTKVRQSQRRRLGSSVVPSRASIRPSIGLAKMPGPVPTPPPPPWASQRREQRHSGPRVCFDFRRQGFCSWGTQCRYSHEETPRRPPRRQEAWGQQGEGDLAAGSGAASSGVARDSSGASGAVGSATAPAGAAASQVSVAK